MTELFFREERYICNTFGRALFSRDADKFHMGLGYF